MPFPVCTGPHSRTVQTPLQTPSLSRSPMGGVQFFELHAALLGPKFSTEARPQCPDVAAGGERSSCALRVCALGNGGGGAGPPGEVYMYDRSVSGDAVFRCLPGLAGPLFVWPSRLARLQNRTRAANFRWFSHTPLAAVPASQFS